MELAQPTLDQVNDLGTDGPPRDRTTAMRRSHLVLTAVGISAAAVTGSAFTAANVVPDPVAGYGEGQVACATVTDIDYTPYATDNTDLDTVVFQSSTDVT